MKEDLLTEKLKNGSIEAFEQIYVTYARQVLLLVSKLIRDSQDVEELVQDIFFELWQKRETLEVAVGFKACLFTIAKRRTIDRYRKQVSAQYFNLLDQQLISKQDVEAEVHYQEISGLMEKQIENLPPKRKLIFTLRQEQGLTNKQIAEQLGISTTMVEKQIKLAHTALRKEFGQLTSIAGLMLSMFLNIF